MCSGQEESIIERLDKAARAYGTMLLAFHRPHVKEEDFADMVMALYAAHRALELVCRELAGGGS